jgi:threonine synthase
MTRNNFKCLICNETVRSDKILRHKQREPNGNNYAILWPEYNCSCNYCHDINVPIYHSTVFSKALGVHKVYILDEGCNLSGSMKDHVVTKTIHLAEQKKRSIFNLASSGNHALSLAIHTQRHGYHALLFVPDSSSNKIRQLATFENVYVLALKDANYEDVYSLSNQINIPEIFNANVSNDLLLTGFQAVARQICSLSPLPSHILAGVGNGTYLSGLTWSFQHRLKQLPKIVPVGMKGAFPFEIAVKKNKKIYKFEDYGVDKTCIDEAAGSIALESYSMPQLFHALKLSNGFPLGGLQNDDLRNAYLLLMNDENLIKNCVIPEPTGIMGLAAAIKYKEKFFHDDILLISFTGNAFTCLDSIQRIVPELMNPISLQLCRKKKYLSFNDKNVYQNITYLNKSFPQKDIEIIIHDCINKFCQK